MSELKNINDNLLNFKKKKVKKNNSPSFYTPLLDLILNDASPDHHYNRERLQLGLCQYCEMEIEPIMHMHEAG